MALDAQNQVFTAADYKILLTLNNGVSKIVLTSVGIDMSAERETESIYAIGQQEPIAEKRNAAKYSGSLELQVGELNQLLALGLLAESTQIENAALSIVSITGTPPFARVFSGVNVNGESISIKAKDKDSKASLKWNARAVNGTV
jgi:hypothetical protein